jgi:predicted HTH transcriptional regulator
MKKGRGPGRPEEGFADKQKELILRIMKRNDPLDMTEAELARETGLIRHTVPKYLKELLKEKKLMLNRTVGKYNFYKIRN